MLVNQDAKRAPKKDSAPIKKSVTCRIVLKCLHRCSMKSLN
jgi:hypothetical protein